MGVRNEADYSGGNPFRNLWAAVIRNAIDDLHRKHSDKRIRKNNGRSQVTRNQAIQFFRSNHSSLPDICRLLDISIVSVRAMAEKEILKNEENL